MKFVQPIRDPAKIEEVRSILIKKSYRDCFMFDLGINTGLRISDIISLKVKDVRDQRHLCLLERKNKHAQRFFINAELKAKIDFYTIGMNEDDYLFPSRNGGHIKRVRAYEIISNAGKQAGLKNIGCHSLRKTFGYHFYKRYKDIAKLQRIFGHSAPSVTLKYIGITHDEIDADLKDFFL